MSTQNIKILNKCEIKQRFDEVFISASDDYMKAVRFDVGKVCKSKLKYLNLYYSTIHKNYCGISDEDMVDISEQFFIQMPLRLKSF